MPRGRNPYAWGQRAMDNMLASPGFNNNPNVEGMGRIRPNKRRDTNTPAGGPISQAPPTDMSRPYVDPMPNPTGTQVPQFRDIVERFLPIDVPGGSATIFPGYDPATSFDYGRFATNPYLDPSGTRADYTGVGPGEYDVLGGYLTNNLGRLGAMREPSYEEQFQRYSGVSNREADKQAAAIREAMGSRGARYSRDTLTAEGDMRRQTAQDLGVQALTVQERLNNARLQEQALTQSGLMGIGAGRQAIEEAGLQRDFGARESAAGRGFESVETGRRSLEALTLAERQRMFDAAQRNADRAGAAYSVGAGNAWSEYLMSRMPPAMLEAMFGYATSFDPPGSVVR